MFKLISSTLLGVFMLFFSGKPASSKCGATVEINGPNTGQVTKVELTNLQTGIIKTYNNPTFPFYYQTNSGPNFQAKFYLSSSIHFAIYSVGWETECNTVNYHPASQGSLTFFATCGDEYQVNFIETADGDSWLCP